MSVKISNVVYEMHTARVIAYYRCPGSLTLTRARTLNTALLRRSFTVVEVFEELHFLLDAGVNHCPDRAPHDHWHRRYP